MNITPHCEQCLYYKETVHVKNQEDSAKVEEYLAEVRDILAKRDETDVAPQVKYRFDQTYIRYFGELNSYAGIKQQYNQLVMDMENEIEEQIEKSEDPVERALIYARIGNYIDFGTRIKVTPEAFIKMLDEESDKNLPADVYGKFLEECASAKKFLLLCDNCGEVVLDKLFVKQLRKRFPHLEVYAMVRGQEAMNDATVEDAEFCGLDQVATIISNGNGVAGTVLKLLGPEADEIIHSADVILSKGQGNYECLNSCDIPIYYSFLCKCDLFTGKFGVPKFTGMFIKS